MKKEYFHRVLILSIFYLCQLQAQQVITPAPGGVQGVEAWLKTEPKEGSTTEYHWKDYGGDGVVLNTYNAGEFFNSYNVEDLTKNEIRFYNFNPAMQLGYLKQGQEDSYREFTLKYTNLSQMMIFGAFAPIGDTFNAYKHLYTVNGKPKEGVSFTTDQVIESQESGKEPLDYGSEIGEDLLEMNYEKEEEYREGAMRLATYYRMNQPNHSIWGEKQEANLSLGDIFNPENINNTSTFGTDFNDRKFSGYIPEFIIYGRYLNPLERRKVESYLALKYGLTIDRSYIKSNGDILWDLSLRPEFNHRITAVIKDDVSALDQTISTTTYEEAPTFSDANDSYFQSDNTKGSSDKRLLTIQSTGLQDGEYAIWGDNDEDLNVQESDQITNLKMMNRDWLLKTNINQQEETNAESWDFEGRPDLWVSTYLAYEDGDVYTHTTNALRLAHSLEAIDGDFELTWEDQYGFIAVGLNRIPWSNSFQVKATGGYLHPIIDYAFFNRTDNGFMEVREVDPTYTQTNKWDVQNVGSSNKTDTDSFMIKRIDDVITYHVNGQLVHTSSRPTTDPLYVQLEGLHGGRRIMNLTLKYQERKATHTIELSYDENKATVFNNLTNNADDNPENDADQIPYLVIDRSGKGTYQTQDTELIKYSSIDTERKKIIFNNIFWDADGNTDDVFTFGQKESDLIAIIEGVNPTCEDDEPYIGGIKIEVKEGVPLFKYTITNQADNTITWTDKFGYVPPEETDTGNYLVESSDIPPGIYEVLVEEVRKTNFTNEGSAALSNTLVEENGYIEYQINDTDSNTKRLGFVTNQTNAIEYGIQQESDSIYYQVNGELTESYPINLEDIVRIKKENTDLVYEVNGVEIHRVTGVLTTNSLYGKVEIDTSGSMKNVDHEGFGLASWSIQTGTIEIEELTTGNTATEIITIVEPDCDNDRDDDGIDDEQDNCPDIPNSNQLDTDADGIGDVCDAQPYGDNNLEVYPVPSTSGEPFTVKIDLDNSSEVIVLIYDMKGRLITEKYIKEQKDLHEVEMILNQIGIYIIKVLSKEGEFTNKITID